jgi:hypothetical protein
VPVDARPEANNRLSAGCVRRQKVVNSVCYERKRELLRESNDLRLRVGGNSLLVATSGAKNIISTMRSLQQIGPHHPTQVVLLMKELVHANLQ